MAAAFPFPVHPHMLRHACGYTLVNQGHETRSIQHYLGHQNIQRTVRYTKSAPTGSNIFGRISTRGGPDRRQSRNCRVHLCVERFRYG